MVTLRADDVKEKEALLLKRDDEGLAVYHHNGLEALQAVPGLCAKPSFWMRSVCSRICRAPLTLVRHETSALSCGAGRVSGGAP